MTSYTIRVVNKSLDDKDFFFFTAPHSVGSYGDPNVYTTTWVARTGSYNEPIDITTTFNFYGWCGPGLRTVGGKTTVKGGVSTGAVRLGKSGSAGSTFLTRYDKTRKHIEFSNSLQIATAGSGCFEIDTGNDFMDVDKLLIGMSLDDPDGSSIPVPVVAISADPEMRYNIGPVVKFYVAVGELSTGDVIDYQEISSTSGLYDFTITGPGAGIRRD